VHSVKKPSKVSLTSIIITSDDFFNIRNVLDAIIFLYLLSVSMKDAPLVGMPHQSPAKDLYATYFYA